MTMPGSIRKQALVALALIGVTACDPPAQEAARSAPRESPPTAENAHAYMLDAERNIGMRIIGGDDESFDIEFTNAPPWLLALPLKDQARNPALERGTWLVLTFAVWSGEDIRSVGSAFAAVARTNGRINLAVTPFADYDKLPDRDTWQHTWATPYWALMQDNRLVKTHVGLLSPQQLEAFLEIPTRDELESPE